MKKLDLTNKRFGRLIAIKDIGISKSRGRLWECLCDCGSVVRINAGDLNSGCTKSCGCLRRETNSKVHRLPGDLAGFNSLFYEYNNRGKIFKLTKQEFKILTKQDCFYCGKKPFSKRKSRLNSNSPAYIYNGLDRIDNNKGYIRNNVVPCCGLCNKMKSNLSQQEFLKHIHKIHDSRF